MPLTDRVVRFAAPNGSRPLLLGDGGGLYLRASKNVKAWIYRDQRGGKDSWLSIGYYPAMSLLQARQKAREMKVQPGGIRTVRQAYEEYQPVLRASYRDPAQIERRFATDILPRIGDRRVDMVSRTMVSDLLQAIVKRGSRVAANRTLPDIKHFFNWCIERGWTEINPAGIITRKSVGGRETSKNRVLVDSELVWLMERLYADRFGARPRLAAGLILLTGQRTGEVLGLGKHEVHGCWWHIPAERTKAGRLNKVYLCPQARYILKTAFREFGLKPFVTMDRQSVNKMVNKLGPDPVFTPHDWRRTMVTKLADAGVEPYILGKMLNHRLTGVWAVYNRAEYLPERRAAWRLWGRMLRKLRRQHAIRYIGSHLPNRVRDEVRAPNPAGGAVQGDVRGEHGTDRLQPLP